MDTDDRFPLIASLNAWSRLGVANRTSLREAIRRGELRAIRTGKRTIRVAYPDLLRWLAMNVVQPEADDDPDEGMKS